MSDYESASGISFKWIGISLLIFLVSQVVISVVFSIVGVLTLGVGFLLFIIAKPISYFIGGYITGRLSPGITIREPAVGAAIISVAGAVFDSSTMAGFNIIWIIVSAAVAYAMALIGAKLGEGIQ